MVLVRRDRGEEEQLMHIWTIVDETKENEKDKT